MRRPNQSAVDPNMESARHNDYRIPQQHRSISKKNRITNEIDIKCARTERLFESPDFAMAIASHTGGTALIFLMRLI